MQTQFSQGTALFMGAMIIYMGVCFGIIAQKHGKNPVVYGLLSVISPINLIILGIWAFGKFEAKKD